MAVRVTRTPAHFHMEQRRPNPPAGEQGGDGDEAALRATMEGVGLLHCDLKDRNYLGVRR